MFVSQIGCLETNIGICNAVTAIAIHFDRQVSPQLVALELDDIAKQVTSGSDRALTAHLHQVLFEELGFRGDIENERMIVGCFFGDKLVSESEVYSRIKKMMGGQQLPETNSAVIEVSTHRQWVARLLANITQALSIQNRPEDIAAVNELYDVLKVAY